MHLHDRGNVEDENIVSWIKLPGTVLRTSTSRKKYRIYRDVVEDGIVLLPETSRDVCSTEAIRKCVKCSVRVCQKNVINRSKTSLHVHLRQPGRDRVFLRMAVASVMLSTDHLGILLFFSVCVHVCD